MDEFTYVGSELELFAAARRWKTYWSGRVRPFVAGDVLEVGAGIGSNTPYLDPGGDGRWVCLEPDKRLVSELRENLRKQPSSREYEVVTGTLSTLGAEQTFDTIAYIDVLEHIEDDRGELELAASRLRPGGRIIVLSPAHQALFTPFDASIGHFRRYDKPMLRSVSPAALELERLFYLDSVGLSLSLGNKLLLRQSMPTSAQIQFWDRYVIPISRLVDRSTFGLVGKSIVGVWRRADGGSGSGLRTGIG